MDVQSCADTACATATTTSTTGIPTTSTTLAPSWATIHAAVIAPRCGNCHNVEGEGGLNRLDDCAAGYANLLNVPSTELPSLDRVEPGLPARSWLMYKLDGDQRGFDGQCLGGSCGDPMPLAPPSLDASVRDALRTWIAGGAANDCP
jgi:hypothetical protein